MAGLSGSDVSQLLLAWNGGDDRALEKLMPIVYDELRRMAHQYMALQQPGHTLQSTALVNEVYLRLVDSANASWQNRIHFFAVCARAMRQILVDWARSRQAQKRGGEVRPLQLDEPLAVTEAQDVDLIALDQALNSLAAMDPRRSRVVELHFFGGLDLEETAEVMKVSSDTVLRDWKLAKSWLRCEMSGEKLDGS
ncbi:MAG TPA: sigma-70 family RNA polymerase sigma factor [Terriglobia bacterium]|nr:sigma-70 family RNA polymerase sigma factor [Terriglobia bacterium]